GLARQALDQVEAARVLEIDRGRALVGIILQEIKRVLVGSGAPDMAAGVAGAGGFDLDHVGAHPGERLGARRPGFELGQVENLHSGKAIFSAHGALPLAGARTLLRGLPPRRGRRSRKWSTAGEGGAWFARPSTHLVLGHPAMPTNRSAKPFL